MTGGVVDARVAVAVDQDDVVDAAQAADDRQVGLVAGAENQGVPLAEPVGELALEILVQRQGAVGGSRTGGAGAVLQKGVARGRHHRRLERQAQVVVGAEHQRGLAVDDHLARAEHALNHGLAGTSASRGEPGSPFLDGLQLVEQIPAVVRHGSSPV